jgi:hypothetical protein
MMEIRYGLSVTANLLEFRFRYFWANQNTPRDETGAVHALRY